MAIFKLLFEIIWNRKNNLPESTEVLMVFSTAAEENSSKKNSAKDDRRSNVDRRKFSYTEYIPERRSEKDRRKGENEEGDADADKSSG